ncbi:hypothetical protein GS506_03640 [Rhodococcus hoagii]|nr:hypothetical protein [Prescottella equi]
MLGCSPVSLLAGTDSAPRAATHGTRAAAPPGSGGNIRRSATHAAVRGGSSVG